MALRQPPQPTPRALRGCHQPGSRVAAAGRPQAVPDDHRSPIWNIARQRMARPRRPQRMWAGGSQLHEAPDRGTYGDDDFRRHARRLTPKPWRVGVSNPKHSFPFCTPEDEVEFAEWLKKYDEASSHFAVCGLATHVGSGVIAPELAPLIKLHDDYTRATLLSNVTEAVNAGNRWWAKYELEDWDFEPPWPLA